MLQRFRKFLSCTESAAEQSPMASPAGQRSCQHQQALSVNIDDVNQSCNPSNPGDPPSDINSWLTYLSELGQVHPQNLTGQIVIEAKTPFAVGGMSTIYEGKWKSLNDSIINRPVRFAFASRKGSILLNIKSRFKLLSRCLIPIPSP